MLSQLIFQYANRDLPAFQQAFPHDWLLWEPGRWKPPASSTVMLGESGGPAPASSKSADSALAVALIPSPNSSFTLGRGNECDAPINDGTLSQLHLVLMRGPNGEWTVRDAGSKNGSWLDGKKLESGKPQPLRDGTRLVAAQVAFTYYSPAGMLARLKQP
jgi:pSer/pThr/pTyr-binding forkhead associated (FHA) protein